MGDGFTGLIACGKAGTAISSIKPRYIFAVITRPSRHDNRVVWLKPDILFEIFSVDYFLVIEGKAALSSVWVAAQNIDSFFLSEILEPSRLRDRLENGGRSGKGISSRLHNASQYV